MYLQRQLQREVLDASTFFKAVLVTGARQVGKTTMLKKLDPARTYVSLDDSDSLALAKADPKMFFERFRPPIIIDEVQRAPELFPYIKLMCDASDERGRFWLTGSEQFSMMKGISESLAGRIGILRLYPLSQAEIDGTSFDAPLDFEMDTLVAREKQAPRITLVDLFKRIHRGGMPAIKDVKEETARKFFSSYVDTYLLRDARNSGGVEDEVKFRKFLVACAAHTGCQLNYSTLASIAEISQPTAKTWVALLERMNIVRLLHTYSGNVLKSLVKMPKLYFFDTGLCAYLTGWLTPEILSLGNAAGRFFETYVVSELTKTLDYSGMPYDLRYYRDEAKNEIDILLEWDGKVHPLEVKLVASPNMRDVKRFGLLEKAGIERGRGGIICLCDTVLPLSRSDCAIPIGVI